MDYDSFAADAPQIPAIAQDNSEERTPCLLLLDCSASMSGAPIEQLKEGLRAFERDIRADPMIASRIAVAIAVVGGPDGAAMLCDWVDGTAFTAPQNLEAAGSTPLGIGMDLALGEVARFKQAMKAGGGTYKRPWLFLITDGCPTDAGWEAAADRCAGAVRDREVVLWPLATDGADHAALARFAGKDGPVFDIRGADLRSMFQWLSTSLAGASRANAGEEIQVYAPGPIVTVGV